MTCKEEIEIGYYETIAGLDKDWKAAMRPCGPAGREGDGRMVQCIGWSIIVRGMCVCVFLYIYIQYMIGSVQGFCSFIGWVIALVISIL